MLTPKPATQSLLKVLVAQCWYLVPRPDVLYGAAGTGGTAVAAVADNTGGTAGKALRRCTLAALAWLWPNECPNPTKICMLNSFSMHPVVSGTQH